jgi:hypothetical protein
VMGVMHRVPREHLFISVVENTQKVCVFIGPHVIDEFGMTTMFGFMGPTRRVKALKLLLLLLLSFVGGLMVVESLIMLFLLLTY